MKDAWATAMSNGKTPTHGYARYVIPGYGGQGRAKVAVFIIRIIAGAGLR